MDHQFSTNSNIYRFDSATNTFQSPLIEWKHQTYYQQYPTRQKNGMLLFKPRDNRLYQKPLPLKIYRNELNTTPNILNTHPRIIGLTEQPGSTVVLHTRPATTQQRMVTDVKEITRNNLKETVNSCNTNVTNALTRVRNKFVKIPPRAKCCPAQQTIYSKNKMFQQVHNNVNDCKKYDCFVNKFDNKHQTCC